ncbi:Fet3 protein [Rickenella mellea]|uniref:Fet3 protein n=1 Tax=Rickenella mellea TaxID=50990 RepID=A0A4Y7Q3W9_9AGAM|nr:Fet3 protein [Rickenella mellea]
MHSTLGVALSLLALSFSLLANAAVQEVWWDITYVQDQNPDGLFPRRVIGVNGTWPPPPLSVSTNDTLMVHATNSLDKPTTLHHHGMFFNSSSWYDGAEGITQCGIPPGSSFTYVIPVNTSGQWGTYWVHAHASGQYVDGLRAPFVLHPPTEVHKYDEEFTVVLGDWYHEEHSVQLNKFINVANPGGAEPIPDSALIYFAQNTTYLPGFGTNTSLPFTPGKTYRLRIVNTSAFAAFFFWIDGHDMRIIEVDGTDVEESPIDVLSVTVAQRYSVLVTARNDTSANWAIHANMDTDMFDTVPDTLNPNATSSITYSSTSALTTLPFIDTYPTMTNDTTLLPIPAIAQLPPATVTIPLVAAFDTLTDGANHAMFNDITYNTPVVPGILTALSMGSNASVVNVYGPGSYVLNEGDIVDIVLMNSDVGKHPFHLHGHKFQIVNRAQDYTSDDPTLNPPLTEGQANPIRRDTVQVPGGTSATLRFVADNPGVWFFHCHIEWHLEVGLAIELISAPLTLQSRIASNAPGQPIPPPELIQQCAAQGIPTSGNAAGHNSTTDLSGLKLGPFEQKLGWRPKGIGAMAGCVLTAVIGMATVVWYALGGHISEEEMEEEIRHAQDAKAARGGGVGKRLRAKIFR